jgi:hypothetical protein
MNTFVTTLLQPSSQNVQHSWKISTLSSINLVGFLMNGFFFKKPHRKKVTSSYFGAAKWPDVSTIVTPWKTATYYSVTKRFIKIIMDHISRVWLGSILHLHLCMHQHFRGKMLRH